MNYYILLGISNTATPDEIKAAYRTKAKDLHPDHSGKDCRPFQELQAAYATLSDPKRKSAYDRILRREWGAQPEPIHSAFRSTARRRPPVEPIDRASPLHKNISLRDSYDTYVPSVEEIFDRIWRNFAGSEVPKSEHPEELRIDVPITNADAQRGGHIQVLIPVSYNCPLCRGNGIIGEYRCMRCTGNGTIRGEIPLIVRIPSGIQNDAILSYSLENYGI